MTRYFLLQTKPSVFRVYDAIHHFPPGVRELVLEPGADSRRKLPQDGKVYLWEGEGRDLVGKGTVMGERQSRPQPKWQHEFSAASEEPDPTTERAIIRVDLRLDPPISRSRIQQDAVLTEAIFFRNATNVQGSIFNVPPEVAEALDNLIDVERRRVAGFSNDVPREYLDAVTEADLHGDFDPSADQDARKRQLREIAIRQGQPRFRGELLEAYGRRCAITDCDVPEALEGAHILPYVNEQRNHVSNGLLLRADVHTLFDLGLIAVGEDFEVLVAPGLRNTNFGVDLSGRKLRLPNSSSAAPNRDALKRHRDSSRI